jgi:hypothetical protein
MVALGSVEDEVERWIQRSGESRFASSNLER